MEEFEVLSNGMKIVQSDRLFRLGTDSMLLSDFCAPTRGQRIADLGCGGGALGVLLCANDPKCEVTGIEIQSEAVRIAQKNITINGLDDRFRVIPGDLREIRTLCPPNSFDCVVSNPPYFPVGSGAVAGSEAIAIARTECCCTLNDLCDCSAWLLRFGGSFCLVHRPERIAELCYTLKARNLEPKRLRLVRDRPGAGISLILLEARLGGKPGVRFDPELVLYDANGEMSAEYRRIYHMSP